MKKWITFTITGLSAVMLLSGCLALDIGGTSTKAPSPTVGQQLIDLQKAKDAGAITEAEYQAEKARLLAKP